MKPKLGDNWCISTMGRSQAADRLCGLELRAWKRRALAQVERWLMSFEWIGVATFVAGIVCVLQGRRVAIFVFMISTLFGTAAASVLTALGSANLRRHIFCSASWWSSRPNARICAAH